MSEELKPNRFDGMWGREIRANAERERVKKQSPTPRPWRWLPDEGQFIVAADDHIVAEVPCQGANPADGAFIVEAANSYDSLKAGLSRLREVLEKIAELDGDDENQRFRLTRFQAAQIARAALNRKGGDAKWANRGTAQP